MRCRTLRSLRRLLPTILIASGASFLPAQFPPALPGAQQPVAAPAITSIPAAPITAPVLADVAIGAGQPRQNQQQLGLFPGAIAQPPPQQVGAGSSPHPTTYSWAGEKQEITDPGPYFYHFYYTGTVQPDARVLSDDKVERIPIRQSDWVNYRRYIIAKLTNFYQVTNGLQPTAFAEYQREISGEAGSLDPLAAGQPQFGAPGTFPTPGFGAPEAGFGQPQPFGQPGFNQPGFNQPGFNQPGAFGQPSPFGQPGAFGQFGQFQQFAPTFDAKAAAEWTFYYDQLVLWQYYCTRTLLNEPSDELIDEPRPTAGATAAVAGIPGGFPTGGADFGNTIDDTGFDDGGGFGFAPTIVAGPQQVVVREVFDAIAEFQNSNANTKYRDKFIDRAQEHEQGVYQAYIDMISRIDQEAFNQEQYDQWLAQRQEQILGFAENWRRLRQGETLILDNTLFLITPDPLEAPPVDAINLAKTEKLTPQDLLNADGTVKKPIVY